MDSYEIRPEDSSCSWFHTRGTRLFSPCLFSSAVECAWMEVQKQERGWDKPGVRVEICKRFFIVFPLNPLFSSAHMWLWFGTNVGVFTGINKTDGRSESSDTHNNTDPPPPSSSYCRWMSGLTLAAPRCTSPDSAHHRSCAPHNVRNDNPTRRESDSSPQPPQSPPSPLRPRSL